MLLIRFIDLFYFFSMVATGIYKGVCHFDVACVPFKPGSARMWPCSTLKNVFGQWM